MKKAFYFFFVLFIAQTQAQTPFNGHVGLYILGASNQPLPTADFSKTFVDGAAVRVFWSSLETTPDVFNWAFLDGEVAKAAAANKKVSISVLGNPKWLEGLGAQQYFYVDKNTNHPTFGDTLPDYVPWDSVFVSRVKNLNQKLGQHFSANPTVSYLNTVAGFFSRNLPKEDVLTPSGWQPIWLSFGYHADTIVAVMKEVLDVYMTAFPTTPQWNSMDYQSFEPAATGHARNYISQQFANYGLATYPSRFGVWREDLAGCNPPPTTQTTSQWYPVIQNPCRNGAQMLWNVQDGPARMNQCGILPNTKSVVIDSAINRGIALGMRYMEVYKIDMEDTTLATTLTAAHARLLAAVQTKYPVADFSFTVNGSTVKFSNNSANGNSYFWDFGDSFTSTDITPVHEYTANGVYAVLLMVTNGCGTAIFQQTVNVTISAVPDLQNGQSVLIFPNPNQGVFTIKMENWSGLECDFALFDWMGRLVKQERKTVHESQLLNFSGIPSGRYWLKIRLENGLEYRVRVLVLD